MAGSVLEVFSFFLDVLLLLGVFGDDGLLLETPELVVVFFEVDDLLGRLLDVVHVLEDVCFVHARVLDLVVLVVGVDVAVVVGE